MLVDASVESSEPGFEVERSGGHATRTEAENAAGSAPPICTYGADRIHAFARFGLKSGPSLAPGHSQR